MGIGNLRGLAGSKNGFLVFLESLPTHEQRKENMLIFPGKARMLDWSQE